MPIQTGVAATIAYAVETTFGTAAAAGGGQLLRRVSSGLQTARESFQANEVRPDYQVSDMRLGSRSVRGTLEGELSIQTYDDFLAAVMRGAWTAGVSVAPAQFATGVTIANGTNANESTITFAGAGNLLTSGFKLGDIVRGTGFTTAANNNRNLRITALTSTVMTVTPRITAQAQQASGWAVSVAGRKLLMGTVSQSFTIDQHYADIDVSERFTGCRIGSAQIRVAPNGMSTVAFEVMGQDGTVLTGAAAPYFTAPAAAPNTAIVTGLDGGLRMNGVEQGIVTQLDLTITTNLSMQPVIGTPIVPDIFYGRTTASGTVSAFLEDERLINAFLNESEIDLVMVMPTASAEPRDFIALNMQRVKLSSVQKTLGTEGGVIAQFGFTPLLRSGGAGTAFDQSTVVIQRSNS